MSRNILVAAAHPDDEVLGCGAVMAKHAAAGDSVHVLIMAEGATSRVGMRDRQACTGELAMLAAAAREAGDILGATSVEVLDFPDNRMDSCDLLDVVKAVEGHMETIKPDTVYTHHGGDLNVDHQVVHQAVMTACRPVPGQSVREILFFEVPSSSEWNTPEPASAFLPNCFVDVSEHLPAKLAALETYQVEMRPWPHARSIISCEHLARWRGASVGAEAAEAFVIGRLVR